MSITLKSLPIQRLLHAPSRPVPRAQATEKNKLSSFHITAPQNPNYEAGRLQRGGEFGKAMVLRDGNRNRRPQTAPKPLPNSLFL